MAPGPWLLTAFAGLSRTENAQVITDSIVKSRTERGKNQAERLALPQGYLVM